VLGELDRHQIRPKTEVLDARIDQLSGKGEALLSWSATPDVAVDDRSRRRLAGSTAIEVGFAELAESDVHHTGSRLHDLAVQFPQPPGELSLRLGWIARRQIDLEVRHGRLSMRFWATAIARIDTWRDSGVIERARRAMSDLFSDLKDERRRAHERLLASVADLTDEQLRWRPGPHAPGIGFHLFHVARWAEHDRQITGGGEQLWNERKLAEAWRLQGAGLGDTGTGMGMGDEASERLVLPDKAVLVAYAKDAFAAFDRFIDAMAEAQLGESTHPPDTQQRPVQAILFMHLAHDNRHLGMIEALRGLLGLTGSATV
jgi:uncharacterized damage-inducible protein DinB